MAGQFDGQGCYVAGILGDFASGSMQDDEGRAFDWANVQVMDAAHGQMFKLSVPDDLRASVADLGAGTVVRLRCTQTNAGKLKLAEIVR